MTVPASGAVAAANQRLLLSCFGAASTVGFQNHPASAGEFPKGFQVLGVRILGLSGGTGSCWVASDVLLTRELGHRPAGLSPVGGSERIQSLGQSFRSASRSFWRHSMRGFHREIN